MSSVLSLNGSGSPKLGIISFCYGRYYAITARNRVSPCTHCTNKNIFLCAIYHLYFLFKYAILYIVIKQTSDGENIVHNVATVPALRLSFTTCRKNGSGKRCGTSQVVFYTLYAPLSMKGKIMNEKVITVTRPTPFTTHYTVRRTDGFLENRIVHRCPKCGVARLIIRSDENSMLWANIVFGFRSCNGNEYIQSYCRSCRCRPRSNGGTNNG